MRVLIADDEQMIRFGLKLVLESLRLDVIVEEAENLDEVVALIAVKNYHLVVLDIHMPGGEGLESLVRFLLKETKVAIFSSHEKNSPRIQSLKEAGVDEFIFKDASVEELKSSLRKCFSNKK